MDYGMDEENWGDGDFDRPLRKRQRKRKPYAIEWLDDFFQTPGKWVVFQRYETLEQAQQALAGKNKGGRVKFGNQFRLSPTNPNKVRP